MSVVVDTLVEGLLDESVARRLIAHCGCTPGAGFGKNGVRYLREKAPGFNVRALHGNPILMLVDFMDTGLECPPAVPVAWLPNRSTRLLLRVVVREIESWLLADRDGIAAFLGVSPARVPVAPETLPDPKQTLVNLARRSRRKAVRMAFTPAPGVSALVGPEYVTSLQEFATSFWDVEAAQTNAASLNRALVRLGELRHIPANDQAFSE
jgi:hypothetical protein